MMEMEEHVEEYETSLKRVQESLQAYPEPYLGIIVEWLLCVIIKA